MRNLPYDPEFATALAPVLEDTKPKELTYVSMELFNVIQCISLMSLCCEGKSDLAEIKC